MTARYDVLGVPVCALQEPEARREVLALATRPRVHGVAYVTFVDVNSAVSAHDDPRVRAAHEKAALVLADGTPIVWHGRLRGHATMRRRVYGPDFMLAFCRQEGKDLRHYLYGGAPGVAEQLAVRLRSEVDLNIVGASTPPFGEPSPEALAADLATIAKAAPDVLWVALGAPKQDLWMARASDMKVDVPVMLGVGAAFDFLAGTKRQAPRWLRDNAGEWLFRLATEPRRLWRRYLITVPRFAVLSLIRCVF